MNLLEPRSHGLTVGAVLALLPANIAEHKILGSVSCLQILAIDLRGSLSLCGLGTLARKFQEVLDDLSFRPEPVSAFRRDTGHRNLRKKLNISTRVDRSTLRLDLISPLALS